jgi:cardiolipin synthase A/B
VEVRLLHSSFAPQAYRERRAVERVVVEDPKDERKPGRQKAREARRRSYRGTDAARLIGRFARAGSVLARALICERLIGREDVGWIAIVSAILFLYAVLGFMYPKWVAWPVAAVFFWLGLAAVSRLITRREPPD